MARKTKASVSRGKPREKAVTLREIVARNIKLQRNKCGLTQEFLGKVAGVTGRYIAELEKKSGVNLTLDSLSRLAGALGVEVVDLICEDKKARKQSLKYVIDLLEQHCKEIEDEE